MCRPQPAAAFAAIDRDFVVALDEDLRREDHVGHVVGNSLSHVPRNGHHHLIAQLAVFYRVVAFLLNCLKASLPVWKFADSSNLPVLESYIFPTTENRNTRLVALRPVPSNVAFST